LAKRGRRDATAAGHWLRSHVGRLDVVVGSPAERVRQTWARIAAELDDPKPARFDERIYGATPTELLDVVHELPDDAGSALLIGHNPDLQELVTLLTGHQFDMKTSSLAVLVWTGRWADASADSAILRNSATPRG